MRDTKMKIKFGIYSFSLLLLLILASCGASRKVTYLQSKESRKGRIVDLPSPRLENVIRFQPDDILGITVNVPGESSVATDYNLPLVPTANTENTSELSINQGVGRQAFLVSKEGTIDFPVIGIIKVAGFTQSEMEKYLKERLKEKLVAPTVVTVRLLNFNISFIGEVNRPGIIAVNRDHINLLEALALAGDMTISGKRDDIRVLRPKQEGGGYTEVSLDLSRESVIFSPYFYLKQNDIVYVQPITQKTQSADIGPWLSNGLGIASFMMSFVTFVLMLTKL